MFSYILTFEFDLKSMVYIHAKNPYLFPPTIFYGRLILS